MLPAALPRRTLRSGKEYSAFDLALGRALTAPTSFDFAQIIQQRLAEEEAGLTEDGDDLSLNLDDTYPEPPTPLEPQTPPSPPPPIPSAPPPPLSAKERDKRKSRARRDKKRDQARAASNNPVLKTVVSKRVREGKAMPLPIDIDAAALPHSRPAWVGDREAQHTPFEFTDPAPAPDISDGLGGIRYTQEEVDALSGTQGFQYVGWLGELSIPIVERRRSVICVLSGTPRDTAAWKRITNGAARMLRERLHRIRLTPERLHHRRAQDSFPALARGYSHGGGQMELGELQNNVANTQVTDELLASEYFIRIAHFTNILFAAWAPLLFAYYTAQMALLALWKPMRRNFVGSIFAACTFNFGPRAVCVPHIDFANLAWGWCAITALGDFDPDLSGHLILWDLRLVIRFPPGSTILIPSALIRHSNVPIRPHEHRCSFVQYTAGGLFRWIRNGFKTAEAWEKLASPKDKAERAAENARRWEEGVAMYSCIDDL